MATIGRPRGARGGSRAVAVTTRSGSSRIGTLSPPPDPTQTDHGAGLPDASGPVGRTDKLQGPGAGAATFHPAALAVRRLRAISKIRSPGAGGRDASRGWSPSSRPQFAPFRANATYRIVSPAPRSL